MQQRVVAASHARTGGDRQRDRATAVPTVRGSLCQTYRHKAYENATTTDRPGPFHLVRDQHRGYSIPHDVIAGMSGETLDAVPPS